jgi:Ankyrin repeats (3 copies)
MLTPKARHLRFTTWAITGLEIGAMLFAGGLLALYLNPFWHFDGGGFLDWRLYWWNAAGETLAAAGLIIEVIALMAAMAVLLSRFSKYSWWPYFLAAGVVFAGLVWIATEGFVTAAEAHFEWNAADGFSAFHVQGPDGEDGRLPQALEAVWQSIIQVQIQPLLRGYFKVNDWRKMNGEVEIRVARGVPAAWPIALGDGGETLEDPDETPLMLAAEREDLEMIATLLAASTKAEVNALDQGGETALILACRNPNASADVVKALLAAGADVNLRARNGYAALTWALARNNSDVARLLRRAGGKP